MAIFYCGYILYYLNKITKINKRVVIKYREWGLQNGCMLVGCYNLKPPFSLTNIGGEYLRIVGILEMVE